MEGRSITQYQKCIISRPVPPSSFFLFHPPVEGKLIQGFEGPDVGDRPRVELIGTDAERGFIDFARAG
ncbi:MAG TPA: hypothetical protein VLK23_10845 [Thermodesulfobacteriota bacterium]|nr:hypothetical protein [Thermodesulfobacteriota bacterium]